MDKTKIISLIVILIGITGLVWWSKIVDSRNAGAAKSQPAEIAESDALKLSETFYDFGTISMKNGNVSKIITVTNTSGEDVLVSDLFTSCMCTNAFILEADGRKRGPFGMAGHGYVPKANMTLAPGASGEIEVVYDPNAHGPAGVGLIERSVLMKDSNNNAVEFQFKVNVTP